MISSIVIEIAFAYQGPFSSHQAKIVGMVVRPAKTQESFYSVKDVDHKDPSKQLQNLVAIDLSTFVFFVDATKEAEREYPDAPSFDIKLPYDFFYPLMPSRGKNLHWSFNCYLWVSVSVTQLMYNLI